jgi:hypothetical protein
MSSEIDTEGHKGSVGFHRESAFLTVKGGNGEDRDLRAGKPVTPSLQKVLALGQQTILLLIFAKTNQYSDIVLHMPGNDSNEMHIATRERIEVYHKQTQWKGRASTATLLHELNTT